MSEKQNRKRRYNEKLEFIAEFERWLKREPSIFRIFKWHKWKKEKPELYKIAEYERTCRTDDGGLIDISKKERK